MTYQLVPGFERGFRWWTQLLGESLRLRQTTCYIRLGLSFLLSLSRLKSLKINFAWLLQPQSRVAGESHANCSQGHGLKTF